MLIVSGEVHLPNWACLEEDFQLVESDACGDAVLYQGMPTGFTLYENVLSASSDYAHDVAFNKLVEYLKILHNAMGRIIVETSFTVDDIKSDVPPKEIDIVDGVVGEVMKIEVVVPMEADIKEVKDMIQQFLTNVKALAVTRKDT